MTFRLPQPGPWCLSNQSANILLMHLVGDAGIAVAYAVIAFMIVRFVRKRRYLEIHNHPFFYVYASFIALCGMTHAMSIYTRYVAPEFEAEGYLIMLTMAVSMIAAFITPASLRFFSRQIHEFRNDKQGLIFQIDDLKRVMNENNEAAAGERKEILDGLRSYIGKMDETVRRVDSATAAVEEAAEEVRKNRPK